jgi:hypothetical protein
MLVPVADVKQVGSWSSKRTISVSGAEFTAYRSLRSTPANGTFLCDGSSTSCYRVAGGSPLLMGAKDAPVPGFTTTAAVRVPHYEFAHYVHLAAHPADGTVLCPVSDRTCYVVAGHAPLAIAPSASPAVAVSHAVVIARTELSHPAHLTARPVDGTVLRTAQKGATYVVRAGVARLEPTTAGAASAVPAVTVDQAAIDNAGIKGAWSHLASAPPTMRLATPNVAVTLSRTASVSWVAPVASSAVTSYDVRTRRAFATGAFSAWTTSVTSTPATSVRTVLGAGYATCFSVRAHNRAGQVGLWSPATCTSRPLDDRSATVLSKGWAAGTSTSAFAGTVLTTTTRKASWLLAGATFTRLGVLATTRPDGGTIAVLVNGKVVSRISLVSATTVYQKYVELPRVKLTTGPVQIVVTSATGRTVQLDGVVVSRA